MGEEVEGLDVGEDVAGGEEAFEVAHLRGGVAADVDDGARREGEELGEEGFVAAFSRRVDDDGGIGGREDRVEAGEDRGGVAGLEGGVGDVVGGRVAPGEADGGFAELDTGDAFEGRRGAEGEEAAAAVSVDEEPGAGGGGLLADVGGERREDERVVLEKIAGEEAELQVADGFGDDRFVVGSDLAAGIAEEKRRGAQVVAGGGTGMDSGAGGGQAFVDGVGRDVAAGDVDDVEAGALAEKADGRWRRGVARGIEMRRDL